MKNQYQELRNRQQEEVNAFPMFFAFDQRQFAEGMRRLGLRPSDMNQVYAIAGTGGFYRKSDAPKLHEIVSSFISGNGLLKLLAVPGKHFM